MSDEKEKIDTAIDDPAPRRGSHRRGLQVNEVDEKKKASMASRFLVAGGILLTCVPCLVLGGYVWFALMFVAALIATFEVIRAPRKKYKWYVYAFIYLMVLSYAYWFLIKWNVASYEEALRYGTLSAWRFGLEEHFETIFISIYGLALELGVLFLFAVADESFTFDDVTYLFTMSVLVGLGIQSLMFVRYLPVRQWMLYLGVSDGNPAFKYWGSLVFVFFAILTCVFNDTWAYFVGILFGRRKMNPRVSPNKTWAGFFGGWILGGISGMVFAMIVDACGYPLLPTMRIFGSGSGWYWVALLAFTIPLIGDLGDMTFSLIKRHFHVKDFGIIFGAHGGMLDRLDSLFFTAIYTSIIAVFVSGGWNFFA